MVPMKVAFSVLFLFVLTHSIEVNVLESDNLRKHFITNSHVVIFTHNMACQNCNEEMKIYKDVVESTSFSEKPVFFTANCTQIEGICKKFKVVQQPTVLIIKSDMTTIRYTKKLESSSFKLFLLRNLSISSGKVSSSHLRIVFLVVILISLIILFIKTFTNSRIDNQTVIEEHAPLVDHSVEQTEAEV